MEKPSAICRQELKEWGSTLADGPREMPYAVPEGYFLAVMRTTLHRIHEDTTGNGEPMPGQEIQLLSPLLAAAGRSMPYQAPPVVGKPWVLAGTPADRTLSEPTIRPKALPKTRRWKPLRAAAAWLLLGMAAWLLRLQTRPAEIPDSLLTADTYNTKMESLDEQSLTRFLSDTEVGSEHIGLEVTWDDEVNAILLGDPSTLDSSLAALPAATLFAFSEETSLHHP